MIVVFCAINSDVYPSEVFGSMSSSARGYDVKLTEFKISLNSGNMVAGC
jgi:hypothetical protein